MPDINFRSYDSWDPRHRVDNKNGYSIQCFDQDLFAEKILNLLDNKIVYTEFQRAGVEKVQTKFTYENIINEHHMIWNKITKSNQALHHRIP
jgi:glycosyltransferase involved in cell wall biosynthesis